MPTRYLKPGICDSETINRCLPLAETLYYRLLVNVDDFGRMDARPAVVRAKCFPLKDHITLDFTHQLLNELHEARLIFIYESNACKYLQLCKWDNVPRSKESKCPSPSLDLLQLHTSASRLHTILPVTVTVTGTETGNRKPELKPETGTVLAAASAPAKKTPKSEPELQAASKATWHAYGKAYFARYGTEPVRNAKVSSVIKLFVQRIGMEEAPLVAAFYVGHNEKFYVQKSHPVDLMLKDAEGLRTQWATGQSMTGTRAGQIDKSQANYSAVSEAMRLLKNEKGEGDAKTP